MLVPFHVNVSGKIILGMAHFPLRSMVGNPVLILCYGLNGNRVENNRMLVYLGYELAQNGIALIRFDYRGLGVSEGDFSETDMQTKMKDINAIVEYTLNVYESDNPNIILVGFSDGIKQILSCVNDLRVPIEGILMLNPVIWSTYEEYGDTLEKLSKKTEFIRHPQSGKIIANRLGHFFSPKYLRQLNQQPSFFFNERKTALFFSSHDTISACTKEKLCKLLPDSPVFTIDSDNHVFSEDTAQRDLAKAIIKIVKFWMKGKK